MLIIANFMLYYYGTNYKLATAEKTFINNRQFNFAKI